MMDSSDDDTSESGALLPDRNGRRVPRFVLVFYLIVITLQSFTFFAIWFRIVPFVRDYYVKEDPTCQCKDPTDILPTATAQIFLLINYMAPIAGGLVSDLAHTRYRVIFVSRLTLAFGLGITMLITYFVDVIPPLAQGYLIGVMVFIMAASSGISKTALFIFGVEQLDSYTNAKTRQSFRRLVFWFFEFGKLLALLLGLLEKSEINLLMHPTLFCTGIILMASFLIIPIFVAPKSFYRFNDPNGWRTFKNIKKSIWNNDDEFDESWSLTDDKPEISDELLSYQRALLRRNGLLVLIFFTFGAFYAGDYFAGIVFPFQDFPKSYSVGVLSYFSSAIILGALPVIEIIIRKCGWYGNMANFYFIGLGMLLSMVSIAISEFEFNFGRTIAKFVLSALSQLCFYPAGFDLSDIEAPSTLRGTSTGLFLGLGTFFGCLIYVIWLVIPPLGVTADKWLDARIIIGTIMGVTFGLYAATSYLYHKAKSDYSKAREEVPNDVLEDSINHRTPMA